MDPPGGVFGPYTVVRELGRGGMGVVYEVRHPEIPRRLALKLITADCADEDTLSRFGREAELLARVSSNPGMRSTASFCLALGALSALPSAGLGWLLAENTNHPGSALFWHRWGGVATVVLSRLVR